METKKTYTLTEINKIFGKRLKDGIVRHEITLPIPEALALHNLAMLSNRPVSKIIAGLVRDQKDPRDLLRQDLREMSREWQSKLALLRKLDHEMGESVETEMYLPEVR